ncbi:MAG TPA: hypothetical protein VIH90_01585 [Candidatus Saccharimonadales bacterium]
MSETTPQSFTTIPESFLMYESDYSSSPARPFAVPWVEATLEIEALQKRRPSESYPNLPTDIRNGQEDLLEAYVDRRLSADVLVGQAEAILSDQRASTAFNSLLGDYVGTDEELESAIFDMDLPLVESSLTEDLSIPTTKLYDYAGFFRDPSTPNEDRLVLVEAHSRAMKEAQRHLDEQLPELMKQYEEAFQQAIDQGILPSQAKPDRKKKLLIDDIYVFASDPVAHALDDSGGSYSAVENIVNVDARLVYEPENLKQVLFHEFTHVYSGKTVTASNKKYVGKDNPHADSEGNIVLSESDIVQALAHNREELAGLFVDVARIGLHSGRLHEFNEAVTEYTSMLLLGQKYEQSDLWSAFQDAITDYYSSDTASGRFTKVERDKIDVMKSKFGSIYLPERIMLAGLVSKGVDEKLFFEAYFESYRRFSKSPDNLMPARFLLDQAVEGITEFRSLRALNNNIRRLNTWAEDPNSRSWDELLDLALELGR